MATYTTNYNLGKPDASDPFGDFRQLFNDNMDEIDANLGGGGGSGSGGSFLLVITADTGETVTATKDGTTLTATEVSTGVYEVEVTSAGTWTLSDGTNTATVDVGIYTATLSSVPEGSTVLPTDDVSIWLACGERTEGYTTLSQVLGDSVCLSALLNNNNANDYLVRSTTWASTITADSSAMTYIGLNNYCANTLLSDTTWETAICNSTYFESVLNVKVPTMTSDTTPEGECICDSYVSGENAYKAFDKNNSTFWESSIIGTSGGQWIGYKFASPQRIVCLINRSSAGATNYVKVQYSDDGVTWTDTGDTYNIKNTDGDKKVFVTSDTAHLCYRTYCTSASSNTRFATTELQFYGRKDI